MGLAFEIPLEYLIIQKGTIRATGNFHKLGSLVASMYHRGEKIFRIFVPKLLNSLSQNQSQRIDLVTLNDPIWLMFSKWVETTNQMKMYFILHCGSLW